MRFKYCPDCGALLTHRTLGDEVDVPWCEVCARPWFDVFPCCVISLVYSRSGRVLLLRQSYISSVYHNLVSGYITPGETAEDAAVREIKEETGLDVLSLRSARSWWFEKKQMLMVGFMAEADDSAPLTLSSEVDSAQWVDASQAPSLVHPEGSISHALVDYFLSHQL